VANHELRRPVGMMLITAEMLQEQPFSEDAAPLLSLLFKSVCQLKDQLDVLQEFSEVRAEVAQLTPQEVRVDLAWKEVCSELAPALHQHTLSVVSDIPEHLSIHVDHDMFKKALRELLRNAIQFSTAGGVIRVRTKHEEPGLFEFSITDTGLGLSENQQDKLLHFALDERDVLSYSAMEGAYYSGMGLGLGIVSEIAKAHGGTVRVTHTPSIGSTFTLSLPHSVSTHGETVHDRAFSQNRAGRG